METVPLIDPPIQSLNLADGRRLTWQEFGDPDGRPVLYFHGGGGISAEGGIFHREAVHNHIRLIATNRPGAGGSSLRPGRPVASYADDLRDLLDQLKIDKFACFGESNGGMVTLAVAAVLAARVQGAVPINPTLPWFDPLARRVSSCAAATAYRLVKYAPWLVARLAARETHVAGSPRSPVNRTMGGFDRRDLIGPPPGTEDDIAQLQRRVTARPDRQALLAELEWAGSDWGFDYYAIPVALDIFCGAHDAQAPFALVLADRNPNARFHCFSYGHNGWSHPEARRRIVERVAAYVDASGGD